MSATTDHVDSAKYGRSVIWIAIIVVVLASIPINIGSLPADVSWLITVCDMMLSGSTLYVDILETNPPFAPMLYMPGVLLARTLGISLEAGTHLIAYAAMIGSLLVSVRILPPQICGEGISSGLILLPSVVVLLLLSQDAYAQREYFAALFCLPILSVFIRHASLGSWGPVSLRLVAAFLAGLTIAIKPPLFAVPGLLLAMHYGWRTRSLMFLFPSGLFVAGLIGVAITAGSLAVFPEYLTDISHLIRDVYLPVRSDFISFLNDKVFVAILIGLGVTLSFVCRRGASPTEKIIHAVGAGFLLVYFIQGKYFTYHLLPAAQFAAISVCLGLYRHMESRGEMNFFGTMKSDAVYLLMVAGALGFLTIGFRDGRPVSFDMEWAKDLETPTVLAISPDIAAGFPLVRRIGGTWVDRNHSQWVARYTRYALATKGLGDEDRSKFERYHLADLRGILDRIETTKPDLILEDILAVNAWLMEELIALKPGFLEDYGVVAKQGGIRILMRKAPAP